MVFNTDTFSLIYHRESLDLGANFVLFLYKLLYLLLAKEVPLLPL